MGDNIIPIKRPKPGDDEETILKLQQEFINKKLTPCAKVINLRPQKSQEQQKPTQKISKFAERRKAEAEKKRISTDQCSGNVFNLSKDNTDKEIKDETKNDPVNNYLQLSSNIILKNIVEKNVNVENFKESISSVKESETGFPQVFSLDNKLDDNETGTTSMFWQSISNNPNKNLKIQSHDETKSSNIVSGSWGNEIHKENLQKLSTMSEKDILAEKRKLECTLDPKIISFLKARKSLQNKTETKNNSTLNIPMEIEEKNLSFLNTKMEIESNNALQVASQDSAVETDIKMETNENNEENIPEPVIDIIKEAGEKGWVHMDSLEVEKVKWMDDLTNSKIDNPSTEEPYNARFDFNGLLLPYTDENVTVDQGLHHHGEEPARPGYSLQELLQLSRSSNQQQRCTALLTLTNILEKTHNGWYDQALQPALLTTLNQKNILLLLRFSLDDSSIGVVTASLQALRAFLFNQIDEICLDKIFWVDTFKEPTLKPVIEDIDDTESLKDHQLAQFDSVATALRSDIILRIRFILSEMQLPPVGISASLEILTRLARHSLETSLNIGCTSNLLEIIVKKFIPLSMNLPVNDVDNKKTVECPMTAAIKLCRILTIYGGKPILEKLKYLKVIHSLLTYVSSDARAEQVRLQIESLRLWRIFLHFGVETDSIIGARLTLMSQLRILESDLNLDSASPLKCDYAAALIAVCKYDDALKQQLSILLAKWSSQLNNVAPTWNNTILISETINSLNDISFLQVNWIKESKLFSRLNKSSNLLSGLKEAVDRYPKSLPGLNTMTYEGKLQPIMNQESCFIFLNTLVNYFLQNSYTSEIKSVINNAEVQKYLRKLTTENWCLERSWFTRIEYLFLVNLIKAESILNSQTDDTLWKIATKLISVLPGDCIAYVKYVLQYSFKPNLDCNHIINSLSNLNIKDSNYLQKSPNSFAFSMYETFISPKGSWSEPAMPKDWIFLPLIEAYSSCKNKNSWEESWTNKIKIMLQLLLIMPELIENLTPSLIFSRLILLYLCNDAFLGTPKENACLAENVVSNIIKKNYKKFELSAPVPGLGSFNDLFVSLCEHFSAYSYNDFMFSNVVLVFAIQKHDVHYRKLLWSEHADILQNITLNSDNLIIPLNEFLYPTENDVSLIETYITALVRNTIKQDRSPIPYKIALHHSAIFLKSDIKLANVMRTRIEKLLNNDKTKLVAEQLLNYESNL